MNNELDQIMMDANLAYGSLENPDFRFVNKARKIGFHQSLIRDISMFANIEDETDVHEGVCDTYIFNDAYFVRLSLVGNYATISKITYNFDKTKSTIDDIGERDQSDPAYKKIQEIFVNQNIKILSRNILDRNVSVCFPLADEKDRISVYELLFSWDLMY